VTTPRKRVAKADDSLVYDSIPVRQYRVLFDDGQLLDIVSWQDSSTMRGFALKIAESRWGKRENRKIAGVGVVKDFGMHSMQNTFP
jgi:hypothetical protein